MKKVLFSLVAISLFATALISCQSNQKGTEETGADSSKIAATVDTSKKAPAISPQQAKKIALAKTGSEILDVSPDVKVETPQFSNEDVNNGFAKFEPLRKEYKDAITNNDAAKIKEVSAKYIQWVKDASTWGNKLTKDENQIYIDHYTKLVTQWKKLSVEVKK